MADPCSNVFAGVHAFSEIETLTIAQYVQARQNASVAKSYTDVDGSAHIGSGYVAAFLGYHSYGQVLLPPWGYKTEFSADHQMQTDLTTAMVQAIKSFSGKTYDAGPNVFPSDPGTSPDWAYGELGVRATMTIELDPKQGSMGFCPPRSLITEVGAEQWEAFKALVGFLDQHGSEPSLQIGPFARFESKGKVEFAGSSNRSHSRNSVDKMTPVTSTSTFAHELHSVRIFILLGIVIFGLDVSRHVTVRN